MGRRAGAIAVAVVAALAPACGDYGARDEGGASTASVGNADILANGATSTSQTDSTTPADGDAGPIPTVTGPPRTVPGNYTQHTDAASGFELTFVVENDVTFPHDAATRFQLHFRNTGTESQRIDAAQTRHMVIVQADGSSIVWDDASCRLKRKSNVDHIPAAVEVPPGESGSYLTSYPSGSNGLETDDPGCPVPAGNYLAVGLLEWCPPDALVQTANGQPVCDESKLVVVQSDPLAITLT